MKGGRSLGTLGRGLLCAMFLKERAASRELEEFREEDLLAICTGTSQPQSISTATWNPQEKGMEREGSCIPCSCD